MFNGIAIGSQFRRPSSNKPCTTNLTFWQSNLDFANNIMLDKSGNNNHAALSGSNTMRFNGLSGGTLIRYPLGYGDHLTTGFTIFVKAYISPDEKFWRKLYLSSEVQFNFGVTAGILQIAYALNQNIVSTSFGNISGSVRNIAVVVNGTNSFFYVDGVTEACNIPTMVSYPNAPLEANGPVGTTSFYKIFDGISNSPLTKAQIDDIFNNQKFDDKNLYTFLPYCWGNGTNAYDVALGLEVPVTGTLDSGIYSTKQDIFHYNLQYGFDLWRKTTDETYLRVPLKFDGTSIKTNGSTIPGFKWQKKLPPLLNAHNLAETKITLPSSGLTDVFNLTSDSDFLTKIFAKFELNKISKIINYLTEPVESCKLKTLTYCNYKKGLDYRPINWGWRDDVIVFKEDGIYKTPYNIDANRMTATRTYNLGSNQAYTTLAAIIAHLTANPATTIEIVCNAEIFYTPYINIINNTNINIVCESGFATFTNDYLTGFPATAWSLESGTTYQTTVTNAATVWDKTQVNEVGGYGKMDKVASLALCRSTANSYYITGSTVYANFFDGRVPVNSGIAIYTTDYCIRFNANRSYYMKNIKHEGGATFLAAARPTLSFYAENCSFLYSTVSNGLTISTGLYVVLINCKANYNMLDGFNYHETSGVSPKLIEINCEGRYNGWDGGTSHNGSSTHENGRSIRINGNYSNNLRNIHDINTTINLLYGCTAINSRGALNENDSFNLGIGFDGTEGTVTYVWGGNYDSGSFRNIYLPALCTLVYDDYELVDTNLLNGTYEKLK